MNITGSYTFDAPPQAVWDLLIDIDAVAACLPGCESMDPIGDNKYRVVLTMGIAAITKTEEREATLEFSHTYYLSGLSIMVGGGAARTTPRARLRSALPPHARAP